mgnify:CR=1 FL=1
MRETVAVGRALGVALPPDFAEQRLAFVDGLPDAMTSSMHHDLKAGKRLEVSWLSGGVAQLGEKAGVPTPMNQRRVGHPRRSTKLARREASWRPSRGALHLSSSCPLPNSRFARCALLRCTCR